MKKNKIVVPALAIIAFSTAASIAGSVAWFTASRQVTVNAGTYAVVKTTSNLECVATSGVGTTASVQANGNPLITLEDATTHNTSKLTDGSFNHKTGIVFAPNATVTGVSAGIPLTDPALATKLKRETIDVADPGKDIDIYTAVTWNLTFKVNFGSIAGHVGLFLNKAASSFTVSGTAYTAKGFRMAFYSTAANTKSTVFADLQTKEDAVVTVPNPAYSATDKAAAEEAGQSYDVPETLPRTNIKYVKDADNFAGTAYDAADYDLIDSADNAELPASGIAAASAQARNDYLGTFIYAENTVVSLSYTVVCWFDGNDPEIVNRTNSSEYQSVTANLEFDAINLG